ncbi:MAG: hypothetical protein KF781_02770 [Chitinophagaceae bacterium]|nr:hypothetical protein [Chitinophagaceae bacterium]MCW5904433.1 hypothetical protein [Chitinophagaceae bacterium]
MGKLIYGYVIVCCFACLNATANDTSINYQLQQSVQGNFTDFTIDNLGNIYLITQTNQIKKLNANLDSVSIFNDVKRYGTIDFIDATNPLKILVYYKSFSTILILDRFLSIKNIIDLRNLHILQVNTIAQSYDNHIWLFDELNATIKKVDDFGKLLFSSADFRVLFDAVSNPSKIIDADGLLYLYNEQQGWLVFDYYGSLKSSYTNATDWKDVQILNKKLIGRKDNQLVAFETTFQNVKMYSVNISLANSIKIIQTDKLLYSLTEKELLIYQRL